MKRNKQLKQNIENFDLYICNLMSELLIEEDEDKLELIQKKIDKATELRCKLSESKVADSYTKEIITGAIGIGSMILVLKHEKADIITTKAFSMATKMFRG